MNVTRIAHLDGDPGVAQTISHMRRLVDAGKKDPLVHETAAHILRSRNVPAYAWEREARAIFDWCRRNIRFTRDVEGAETLHHPADIIQLGIGDCDDFTVLICSLLATIGCASRIVTVATDPEPDAEFSHVFPEALIEGRWVAMDCARQHPWFGRTPEHFSRWRTWSLDSDEYSDLRGGSNMRGLGIGVTQIAPRGQAPAGAWRANVFPAFRSKGGLGSYLREFPVPPPAQRRARPPLGFGTYGPAAAAKLGLLGQDGFDWSALTGAITAATTGTANIITAERANPYNLVPTTSMAAQQGRAPGTIITAGTAYGTTPGYSLSAPGTFLGIPTETALLLGLGLVAIVAMER